MNNQPTPTHHRIVPIALIILGLPIGVFVGFLLVANIFFHDEQPPNDAALVLPDINVSTTANAFTDIQKLDPDVRAADPDLDEPYTDEKVDAMLAGGTWDEAYVTAIVKKYGQAITDFRTAASQPVYQDPATARPSQLDNNYIPDVARSVRYISKIIAIEAVQKAKSGDVSGALTEAQEIIRLGDLMESGQGTLIEWLVGGSIKHIGLAADRQIALETSLTAEQARATSLGLESYRGTPDGLVRALKLEYAYTKNYVSQRHDLGQIYDSFFLVVNSDDNSVVHRSTTGKVISALDATGVTRFYYWPNQSWRFLVDRRLQDIQLAEADCRTADYTPTQPATYSQRNGLARLIEPNTIGKLLADIGSVSLGGAATKQCNESLAVAATQVALAVSAYRHDQNKLPTTLEELVPTYLPAVPLDPYNNQPLRYLPAEKLVYSVGPARNDIGGSPVITAWQQQDNPSFAVSK
ncbi:MAG: hypothetical protein HY975_00765 [Candidatus Kerfeldbacteria bacterium]|nr:hypothetical protein [Candidatus Kerfeldbacteria bacterium]